MRSIFLLLLTVCAAGVAQATTVEDMVQAARTAIEAGDFEKASALLDEAEGFAPNSPIPVTREGLRNIAFFRGVLDHYLGEGVASGYPTDSTMNFFRQALAHDLNFEWDRNLVADPEGGVEYVFRQLQDEVSSRNQSDSRVPVDATIRVFVDGGLVTADDFIIHGRHLVQVMCPDSRVLGQWVDFGDSPDFGCMCGQDLCFEGAKDPVVEARTPRAGFDPSLVILGSGAALLTGGLLTHTLGVNPAFAEIEAARQDPHGINRSEADELTSQFKARRSIAIGCYIGGALALGAGGGLMVMDAVSIHPFGHGLGMSGRF